MANEHNKQGNCWHRSVAYKRGEFNDICGKHDEPRGECSGCPRCNACDEKDKKDKLQAGVR